MRALTAQELIAKLQELPEQTKITFIKYDPEGRRKTVMDVVDMTDEGSIVLGKTFHTYYYDPEEN